MKILPIKLPDEMYEDLKTVSVRDSLPMAEIIREYLGKEIKRKAEIYKRQLKEQAPLDFFERAKKHIHTGPTYFKDKSDDEILYGGELE